MRGSWQRPHHANSRLPIRGLHASFGGQHYFAQVDGDEIRFGEQSMSPSQFASLRCSGNRNAWKAL